MLYHEDPLEREELIRNYLLRRLDAAATEAFESHYLACEECHEELGTTQLLLSGLTQTKVDARRLEDVLVLEFTSPAHLTRNSPELKALHQGVLEQKDTKVLIDLSRVSRIDSAGLGLLMSCYSHAVSHHGMLKLLRPTAPVQELLRLTRLDSVVETFHDETQAVQSFQLS